jgi:hypothetical protein
MVNAVAEYAVTPSTNVSVDPADNAGDPDLMRADARYAKVVPASDGEEFAKVTLNSIEFVTPLTTRQGNVVLADTVYSADDAPKISTLVIINDDKADVGVKANAAEHKYVPESKAATLLLFAAEVLTVIVYPAAI